MRTQRARFTTTALVLFAGALWAPGALAQPATAPAAPASASTGEKLPAAKEILDRYIEVTGGRAAYEKITSRVMSSSVTVKPMDMQMKMTLFQKAPGSQVMVIDMPQMGEMSTGTDGTIAWVSSAVMGSYLMKGQELKDAVNRALFNAELDYSRIYKTIECTGTETIDNQRCYTLVFTPEEGEAATSYYAVDSGFLVRTKVTAKMKSNSIESTSTMADYKDVDGIKYPHTMRISQAGAPGEQVATIEKIEHNVDIPAERLTPPPAIQKLLEKEKAKSEEKAAPAPK